MAKDSYIRFRISDAEKSDILLRADNHDMSLTEFLTQLGQTGIFPPNRVPCNQHDIPHDKYDGLTCLTCEAIESHGDI